MKKFIAGILVGVAVTTAGSVFAEDGLNKIEAYLRPSLPITLDGNPISLDSPPVMVDGSTYLKLRDVAGLTGLGVNWNEKTQTVELDSSGGSIASKAIITDDMDQETKDKLEEWEKNRQESLKQQEDFLKQQEEFNKQQDEAKAKVQAELDAAEKERQKFLEDYEKIKAELDEKNQDQQQNQ